MSKYGDNMRKHLNLIPFQTNLPNGTTQAERGDVTIPTSQGTYTVSKETHTVDDVDLSTYELMMGGNKIGGISVESYPDGGSLSFSLSNGQRFKWTRPTDIEENITFTQEPPLYSNDPSKLITREVFVNTIAPLLGSADPAFLKEINTIMDMDAQQALRLKERDVRRERVAQPIIEMPIIFMQTDASRSCTAIWQHVSQRMHAPDYVYCNKEKQPASDVQPIHPSQGKVLESHFIGVLHKRNHVPPSDHVTLPYHLLSSIGREGMDALIDRYWKKGIMIQSEYCADESIAQSLPGLKKDVHPRDRR